MRVLITANSLTDIGGVQTYVRDLARWLLEREHTPVVYSPHLGAAARQIERLTVPVTDDLGTIAVAPDVIHGNQTLETLTALLHFGGVPAIFVTHGWRGSIALAPRFPRVRRYIAVDHTCADRLLLREGIPADRVTVLLNAVDTTRFAQRAALPAKPRRAIVFGNNAHELSFVPAIEEACRREGIAVDVIGSLSNASTETPEHLLGQYDLAFAKSKCAIEAMATGLAVILCDTGGLGGLVTSANVEPLRRYNFGIRTLRGEITADAIRAELARYDAADALKVSDTIRRVASDETLHASLLAIYQEVIAERFETTLEEEARAAARVLTDLAKAQATVASDLSSFTKAAHRVLRTPVVGRVMGSAARWLARKP
ncbi:MAG TPA: glycosyltransferase [Thermoanaerobaculia bacterium]|nr:glycosyltransferase [Thermoanaerobaculia bacterium]